MANKKENTDAEVVEEIVEDELESLTDAEKELEAVLADDELLADMPELKAPEKLRIRERNRLLALVLQADEMNSRSLTGKEQQVAALDLMAGIDEFAESIAKNQDAYIEWSEGRNYEAFLAIMNRYATALGK